MDEDYQRTDIIDAKFQSLNWKVREYLNSLDIIQNWFLEAQIDEVENNLLKILPFESAN